MHETETQRDPVEELAAEFIERQRHGESVSIEDYATEHPDHADRIREFFPTMLALEKAKVRKKRSGDGRATLAGVTLDQLNDFRIIREIGRGGMGVVFEAEEMSLDRHVALKVLPRHSLMEEKHLQRFQREAKTAANLHHTNIVPVFGVGQQDGFHYYVMQLIPSIGLDHFLRHVAKLEADNAESLSEISLRDVSIDLCHEADATERDTDEVEPAESEPRTTSYWDDVARVGIQAADALAYAHKQGLLHRDVKPANLLLDQDANIWVSDFGLAKALENDGLSRTREVVGTLRYIAPEQFAGETDARSDIYSLGLTLYEMLMLQPAFQNVDQSQLMRQITDGQTARPRKLRPEVPRDLETIVLKAISREPAHRYQSAEELSGDLRRFLDDLPILARPVTSPERVWRWAKRNPAIAGLSVTALVLLVMVAIVASLGYVRESAQREKAELTLTTSLEVLDKIYQRLAPERRLSASAQTVGSDDEQSFSVPVQPVISKESAALLEEILPFYDRFAAQDTDNEILRAEAAKANRRVGDIYHRLGQFEQASAAYQRAVERYEQLSRTTSNDEQYQTEIARVRNEQGIMYRSQGTFGQAVESHQSALKVLQSLGSIESQPAQTRYELARTLYLLGRRKRPEPGQPRDGLTSRTNRRPRERPEGRPNRPLAGPDIDENARNQLNRAITLLTKLDEELQSDPESQYLMALCHRELARGYLSEGMATAIDILEDLSTRFPDVADFRFELSETYAMVDVRRLHEGQWSDAEKRMDKAIDLIDDLVGQHPNVPDYAHARAHIYHKLATIVLRSPASALEDWPLRVLESESLYRSAIRFEQSLSEQFPEAWSYRIWLSMMQSSLARLLQEQDRLKEARSVYEESISVLHNLIEERSQLTFLHHLLFNRYRILARLLHDLGDLDAGHNARERAGWHREQASATSLPVIPDPEQEIGPPPGIRGR